MGSGGSKKNAEVAPGPRLNIAFPAGHLQNGNDAAAPLGESYQTLETFVPACRIKWGRKAITSGLMDEIQKITGQRQAFFSYDGDEKRPGAGFFNPYEFEQDDDKSKWKFIVLRWDATLTPQENMQNEKWEVNLQHDLGLRGSAFLPFYVHTGASPLPDFSDFEFSPNFESSGVPENERNIFLMNPKRQLEYYSFDEIKRMIVGAQNDKERAISDTVMFFKQLPEASNVVIYL